MADQPEQHGAQRRDRVARRETDVVGEHRATTGGRRRAQITETQVEIELTESFSGPIPHPAFLEAYEHVVPGSARQLVEIFTGEVQHRRDLERREDSRLSRGQTMGFIIAVLFLAGAIGLGLMGYPTHGVVLATVDIVALVATFLRNRRTGETDLT